MVKVCVPPTNAPTAQFNPALYLIHSHSITHGDSSPNKRLWSHAIAMIDSLIVWSICGTIGFRYKLACMIRKRSTFELSSDVAPAASSSHWGCEDELSSDVGEGALQRHVARRQKVGTWYPAGPETLAEALDWVSADMQSIADHDRRHGANFMQSLIKKLQNGIVFTSCYSGSGMAEAAAARILEHSKMMNPGIDMHLNFWSVTEKDASTREILAAHTAPSRALHRFVDVLDRVPAYTLAKCKEEEANAMAALRQLGDELEGQEISKDEFKRMKDGLGTAYIATITGLLKNCRFKEKCWCEEHGQECYISPRSCEAYALCLWHDVTGTTCCPFSSMSSSVSGFSGEWVDPATLPCLVWCMSMAFYEPDLVTHECVRGFQESQLVAAFDGEGTEGSSDMPRQSQFARSTLSGTRFPGYDNFSLVFSPSHLGIPSERMRKYSQFRLRAVNNVHGPEGPEQTKMLDQHELFRSIFFRNCISDASMYMVAKRGMLAAHRHRLAAESGLAWIMDWSHVCDEEKAPPCRRISPTISLRRPHFPIPSTCPLPTNHPTQTHHKHFTKL